MTIQMPALINRINATQAAVTWWWDHRHQTAGRTILREARKQLSTTSTTLGGGRNPFYFSEQHSVAKTDHNKHITDWEQIIVFHSAANFSGLVNVCPWSTPQCRKHCLGHTSGRLRFTNAQTAQHVRTTFLVNHTTQALICQLAEAERHTKRIHKCGKKAAARLNGDSDLPWEQAAWYLELLHEAGIDQLFDYTKGAHRPAETHYLAPGIRYHLSVSATETTMYQDIVPGMVIIVDIKAKHPIPDTYANYPTVDGDWTNGDLRFLDPTNTHVTLIRSKGSLKKIRGTEKGFVKEAECNPEVIYSNKPQRRQLAVAAL
jgi:hypothetical protein